MLSVRNKGTVEKIDIPPDKLEEAKRILKSDHVAEADKRDLMRNLKMGRCCVCDKYATHKVSYDIDGATLIERYCDACLRRVNETTVKTPEDYGLVIGDTKQVRTCK